MVGFWYQGAKCGSQAGPAFQEASLGKVFFFFSCIAGQVRDMFGQLLEIRKKLIPSYVPEVSLEDETTHKPKQTNNKNPPTKQTHKTKHRPGNAQNFRCQPHLHLHFHSQAGLLRQA